MDQSSSVIIKAITKENVESMLDFQGIISFLVISIGCCNSYSKKLYVLAVLGVTDVVGWADNSVAIVTASSVETSFFRPTDSWSDAFIDIF